MRRPCRARRRLRRSCADGPAPDRARSRMPPCAWVCAVISCARYSVMVPSGASGADASNRRAQSAAGTTCFRIAFGSALISAVTNSSRRPGTCQSKPSGESPGSSGIGTVTVTPSSGWPGSKRYESRSVSVALPPAVRVAVVGDRLLLLDQVATRPSSAGRASRRAPASTSPRSLGCWRPRAAPGGRRSRTRPRRPAGCRAAAFAPRPRRAACGGPPLACWNGLLRVPIAIHQGVADEQVTRVGQVHPRVLHLAPRDDRHAVQGHALVADHRTLLAFPVRLRSSCA